MRLIAAAVLLLASSAAATPCTVTVEPAMDPRCEARGANCGPSGSTDATIWFRATLTGDCGSRPAEWSVTPGRPDGWVGGWHREPGAVECGDGWCSSRAWLRGPAGKYDVTATSESGSTATIGATIQPPAVDSARTQECAQDPARLTVADLRCLLATAPDAARVAVSVDGHVLRSLTVVTPTCWQGLAEPYGIAAPCDQLPSETEPDVVALY